MKNIIKNKYHFRCNITITDGYLIKVKEYRGVATWEDYINTNIRMRFKIL